MTETRDRQIAEFEAAERALHDRHGLTAESRRLTVRHAGAPFTARVVEAGAGQPTLFVHGGGSTAAEWTPLLARLPDRRCIAVDRPGCGGTDPFDYRGVDVRRHAVGFLEGLLDALELDRAPIVANSMGALWSLWLAIDRPERVESLALLGAPALILGSSAPLPVRLMGVRGVNRLLARLSPPSPNGMRRIMDMVAGRPAAERMAPEFVEAAYRGQVVGGAQASWQTLAGRVVRLRGCRLRLDEDELRRVRQPTLLVWGDDDSFAGPDHGRRAVAAMPDARLEVVSGGHLPWWDQPRRCGELVSSFLDAAEDVAASRSAGSTAG